MRILLIQVVLVVGILIISARLLRGRGARVVALRRIGMALLQAADGLARPAMDGGPVERVGAILNFTPSGKRDEVLSGLDEDDADFAREVRKSIFTWAMAPSADSEAMSLMVWVS